MREDSRMKNLQIPKSFFCGDTWRIATGIAPVVGSTMTAYLRGQSSAASIVEDGVCVFSSQTTSELKTGQYQIFITADNGLERETVAHGSFSVLPNPADTTQCDPRTHAQKMLSAYEQALLECVEHGQLLVSEYEIQGRKMKFTTPSEIQDQIDYWRGRVNSESKKKRTLKVYF